jgi:hypothetical protein
VGVAVGVAEEVGIGVTFAFGTAATGLLHTSFFPDLMHV